MMVENEIKVGRLDIPDIVGLIKRRFDRGAQVVFRTEDCSNHKIYILETLVTKLGGYSFVNDLISRAFQTTDENSDETRTRFYFGQWGCYGKHEVCCFELYYPIGQPRDLKETQKIFLRAAEEVLRGENK